MDVPTAKAVGTMRPGRYALAGATALAALSLAGGTAFGARTYPDPSGDLKGGAGPDVTALRITDTKAKVSFRVRFAKAPPLRASAKGGWVDMLLIGIDVAPFGALPIAPGEGWPGAEFALGTHGPSTTGLMVRTGNGVPVAKRRVATFPITTRGATLTFSIPRGTLGAATSFRFIVASAREMQSDTGGGVDVAPASGAFRYTLTG
jgi:hypothetical protein